MKNASKFVKLLTYTTNGWRIRLLLLMMLSIWIAWRDYGFKAWAQCSVVVVVVRWWSWNYEKLFLIFFKRGTDCQKIPLPFNTNTTMMMTTLLETQLVLITHRHRRGAYFVVCHLMRVLLLLLLMLTMMMERHKNRFDLILLRQRH